MRAMSRPSTPLPDDQVGQRGAGGGHGVVGGGSQRQQHGALAEILGNGMDAGAGHHDAPGRAAEQAADIAEATGAGDEDVLADTAAGFAARYGDPADRFVAGHQRVSHPGEGRHTARPEKPFGAGADAAVGDVDDDVAVTGRRERQVRGATGFQAPG